MFDSIYLASQSPRRQELLHQIGVRFSLLLPHTDEDSEALEIALPNEPARIYVQRVTNLKAQAAVQRCNKRHLPHLPILVADTTVSLNETILGKPSDVTHAQAILAQLSGSRHHVYTAIAIFDPRRGEIYQALSSSWVQFAKLSPSQIAYYVASGEPFGKAGAYGIQGRAAAFIERIEGSYSGIMGLPLFETAQLLRRCAVSF
jgi:septum formation protein